MELESCDAWLKHMIQSIRTTLENQNQNQNISRLIWTLLLKESKYKEQFFNHFSSCLPLILEWFHSYKSFMTIHSSFQSVIHDVSSFLQNRIWKYIIQRLSLQNHWFLGALPNHSYGYQVLDMVIQTIEDCLCTCFKPSFHIKYTYPTNHNAASASSTSWPVHKSTHPPIPPTPPTPPKSKKFEIILNNESRRESSSYSSRRHHKSKSRSDRHYKNGHKNGHSAHSRSSHSDDRSSDDDDDDSDNDHH
jgi:hypothetical protein